MNYHYRAKKNYKIIYIILTIVAVVALAVILSFIFQHATTKLESGIPNILVLPELSTAGYMKVSVDSDIDEAGGMVILTGDCYQLIANTEEVQAESIMNGLVKRINVRPNTHDLMKDALDNLGIEVVMVKITELRNQTFISKLIIKQESKFVSLDSRPSDAIALAVRTDSPVYIKDDLMKSQGKYIC